MARSHRTGSRSESASQAGSNVPSNASSGFYKPQAIEKRPGGPDQAVIDALSSGGKMSACSRGRPLSERLCKTCKDVAEKCPEGIMCKFLARRIEAHLMEPTNCKASDSDMQDLVFRFVKELAGKDDIRAKQVMATNLKPTEQRVLFFVRQQKANVLKLNFCQEQLARSKKAEQVEKEVPDFLKRLKIQMARSEASSPTKDAAKLKDAPEPEKYEVYALMQMFKLLEEFMPFLAKAREESAARAEEAKDKGEKLKLSMNEDSDHVDKFFATQKYNAGDKELMKGVLLMSCS